MTTRTEEKTSVHATIKRDIICKDHLRDYTVLIHSLQTPQMQAMPLHWEPVHADHLSWQMTTCIEDKLDGKFKQADICCCTTPRHANSFSW